MIEQVFGALKNRWTILKNLNMGVYRVATITLACCVPHNYCEIFSERVPLPINFDQCADHFVGVPRGPLRVPGDGRASKVAEEQMRVTLVARNPYV